MIHTFSGVGSISVARTNRKDYKHYLRPDDDLDKYLKEAMINARAFDFIQLPFFSHDKKVEDQAKYLFGRPMNEVLKNPTKCYNHTNIDEEREYLYRINSMSLKLYKYIVALKCRRVGYEIRKK